MRAVFHGGAVGVVLCAVAVLGAGCSLETADGTVESGNEAIAEGKVDEAIAAYAEAAAKLPESPPLNFDRGLAASLGGDHAGAASYLLRALEAKDPTLVQKVNSALGVAYAREALALERAPAAPADPNGSNDPNGPKGAAPEPAANGKPELPAAAMDKWKLAVTFLSDALVLNPNDAEARRSLEVALLRVDPPCATRDDKYEDNDQVAAAKLLEVKADEPKESQSPEAAEAAAEAGKDKLHWREQLFSCPDDDDWYALDLTAGDRVALAPTVPKDAGRLAFELLKPDGTRAWGWTSSKDDGAPHFEFTVLAADAGKWAVHVSNVDVDEVSYGLDVTVRPACEKNEDRYEDDDQAAAAKTLTPGPVPDLKLCPGDEDWYAVTLAAGESLFLYAQPADKGEDSDKDKAADKTADGAPPVMPFAIEILDEAGTVRGRGAPIDRSQVSTLLMPGAGRYLVRVYDPASAGREPFEGRYSLQVEVVPPCPEGDDRFEDNDDAATATDFMEASQPPAQQGQAMPTGQAPKGPPVVFARVCPGDVDWWKLTSPGDKPAVVSIVFDHGQGDLALELFDEGGKSIASSDTSSPTQNGEAVALPMPPEAKTDAKPDPNAPPEPEAKAPPQTFTLKVSARPDAQNFYLLRLDNPSGGGGDSSDDKDDSKDDKSDSDKQDGKDGKDDKDKKDQQDQKGPQEDKPKDKPQDQKDKEDQAKKDQPNPLQDALDNLDRNPDNLPARDAARKSPLANQKPLKDW